MENTKEIQVYIDILKNLPTKKVTTSNLTKGIYTPFINEVLFFSYQNMESVQSAIDLFPIIICFGFAVDKFNNKFWLKGLNLNYLPINLRIEAIKLLIDVRKEIHVNNGDMVEYNAYEVFKSYFGDIVNSCYKKYDTDYISFMKIIPQTKWNSMCQFPLNTFIKLINKNK